MKIQCNVCEAAEAKVLCCADEAALCWECDEKVHAANKLASKHQRVPLSTSSSHMPKCDICQVCCFCGFFYYYSVFSLVGLCRREIFCSLESIRRAKYVGKGAGKWEV